MKTVCAYTSVCEEDRRWIPQYLAEAERLEIPFVMHFDRWRSDCNKDNVILHRLCVGATSQNDPAVEFNEMHKQQPFDAAVDRGSDWAMAWDIDETYERDARRKVDEIVALDADYVDVRWVNLWGDAGHVRADGTFSDGHRVKFYNLQDGRRWKFDHKVTNGAKLYGPNGQFDPLVKLVKHDLTCLHWGMMTRELREEHKRRWDRIYTAAVGNNPYGFWRDALDEDKYPPVLAENVWL